MRNKEGAAEPGWQNSNAKMDIGEMFWLAFDNPPGFLEVELAGSPREGRGRNVFGLSDRAEIAASSN